MKKEAGNIIPENYVVFDLETTGFSPENNEIIEIGAVRIQKKKIKEKFQTYVKPRGKILPHITQLTGITEDMVKNAPYIEDAVPKFVSFIKNDILFAHNALFDSRFILPICFLLGYNIDNEIRDSLKLARKYIKSENHKLETLKNLLGIKVRSHNAIDDGIVTYQVIEECRKIQDLLKIK